MDWTTDGRTLAGGCGSSKGVLYQRKARASHFISELAIPRVDWAIDVTVPTIHATNAVQGMSVYPLARKHEGGWSCLALDNDREM